MTTEETKVVVSAPAAGTPMCALEYTYQGQTNEISVPLDEGILQVREKLVQRAIDAEKEYKSAELKPRDKVVRAIAQQMNTAFEAADDFVREQVDAANKAAASGAREQSDLLVALDQAERQRAEREEAIRKAKNTNRHKAKRNHVEVPKPLDPPVFASQPQFKDFKFVGMMPPTLVANDVAQKIGSGKPYEQYCEQKPWETGLRMLLVKTTMVVERPPTFQENVESADNDDDDDADADPDDKLTDEEKEAKILSDARAANERAVRADVYYVFYMMSKENFLKKNKESDIRMVKSVPAGGVVPMAVMLDICAVHGLAAGQDKTQPTDDDLKLAHVNQELLMDGFEQYMSRRNVKMGRRVEQMFPIVSKFLTIFLGRSLVKRWEDMAPHFPEPLLVSVDVHRQMTHVDIDNIRIAPHSVLSDTLAKAINEWMDLARQAGAAGKDKTPSESMQSKLIDMKNTVAQLKRCDEALRELNPRNNIAIELVAKGSWLDQGQETCAVFPVLVDHEEIKARAKAVDDELAEKQRETEQTKTDEDEQPSEKEEEEGDQKEEKGDPPAPAAPELAEK